MKANIAGAEVDCYSFDEVVDLTIRHALIETSPKYYRYTQCTAI